MFWYQKEKGMFSFCGSSLQYFMVPYSAQFLKRLGIQAAFGKSLKDICYILLRPLSSVILNFLRV